MHDSARQTLIELREEFGLSLRNDAHRLQAHLRDMTPGRHAGIHLPGRAR